MGIDGIGKGRGAPPADGSAGGIDNVAKKGEVGRPFQVERPTENKPAGIAGAGAAGAVDASSPLARLRAGEIDVHGYVDLKVDEATKEIAKMPGIDPATLDDIKRTLREQIATDPGLVDLVRTATGATPKAPEE